MTASTDAKTLEAMREGTDEEWAKTLREMEGEVPEPRTDETMKPSLLDEQIALEGGVAPGEAWTTKFGEWLYIADRDALLIEMAAAISQKLEGDPFWLLVQGPPGSGKTETLRAFQGDGFVNLSTLTPQALISGLKKGPKFDLLPKLDGKVLIVKDFGSILTMHRELRDQLFSYLREAYDGQFSKAFGSQAGMKSYKSRFTILAGVTGIVEAYRKLWAVLGERFLRLRPITDPEKTLEVAANLRGHEETMRKDLRTATAICVGLCRARLENPPRIEPDFMPKLMSLARLVALARTPVIRDRQHTVIVRPEPEVATRLTKQFCKILPCLSVVNNNESAAEPEYRLVKRIARDTLADYKVGILEFLAGHGNQDHRTGEVGAAVRAPTSTVRERLEDLWSLGLVDRHGDSSCFEWKISDLAARLFRESEWDMMEEEEGEF